MPQQADLRRATSLCSPRRNRIAPPTWADEIFGTGTASVGHRVTATHSHQCSTSCRTGSTLYSSRALVMVAAQSSSNLASAAGSSLATAARIATGVRSGCGKAGPK
jgi:hypothetical protein